MVYIIIRFLKPLHDIWKQYRDKQNGKFYVELWCYNIKKTFCLTGLKSLIIVYSLQTKGSFLNFGDEKPVWWDSSMNGVI